MKINKWKERERDALRSGVIGSERKERRVKRNKRKWKEGRDMGVEGKGKRWKREGEREGMGKKR